MFMNLGSHTQTHSIFNVVKLDIHFLSYGGHQNKQKSFC